MQCLMEWSNCPYSNTFPRSLQLYTPRSADFTFFDLRVSGLKQVRYVDFFNIKKKKDKILSKCTLSALDMPVLQHAHKRRTGCRV